jgi:biofilm protein TabA
MILDRIDRMSLHVPSLPVLERLSEALAAVRTGALAATDGRVDLGEDLYLLVSTGTTKAPSEVAWEAHRAFLDLHMVLSGREGLGRTDLRDARARTEYDAATDAQLFDADGPTTALVLAPGDFAVFFPGDVHRTWVAVEGPGPLRKVVAKIGTRYAAWK